MTVTKAQLEGVAKWLRYLLSRNTVVEIRVKYIDLVGRSKWYSGYFNGVREIIEQTRIIHSPRERLGYNDIPGSGEADAVYYSLQPIRPEFFAQSPNGLKLGNAMVTNGDAICYRSLLIDADYERTPSDISTTDAEKAETYAVIKNCHEYLISRGIHPLLADSGNGYHLHVYTPSYPCTDETERKLKSILAHLESKFSAGNVHIDQTVTNPGRVCKLYGTVAGKGANVTTESPAGIRPHRVSFVAWDKAPEDYDILSIFSDVAVDTPSKSEKSAEAVDASTQASHATALRTCLQSSGLSFREKTTSSGRVVFEFEDCPVHTDNDNHHYECCVMVETSGMYSAKCQHDETKGWKDFKPVIKFSGVEPAADNPHDPLSWTSAAPPPVESVFVIEEFPETAAEVAPCDYLVPCGSEGIFQRGTVVPVAAASFTGKTVAMFHGIIGPALTGQPILGRFAPLAKPISVLYINTDYGRDNFYHKFLYPFGWKKQPVSSLRFLHTRNLPQFTAGTLITYLNQYGGAYDLIVIDTLTSLFPDLVWGGKSSASSQTTCVDFVKGLSSAAIKNKNVVAPYIHTSKKPDARTDRRPDTLDPDRAMGPLIRICEAAIGLYPCYWQIDMPNGKHNKKGEEMTTPIYDPIYGNACVVGLKNVPLLIGRDNVSEFVVDNVSVPRRLDWICHKGYIKLADISQLDDLAAVEKVRMWAEAFRGESATMSDAAIATKLSLTQVWQSINYHGALSNTPLICDGNTIKAMPPEMVVPITDLVEAMSR
jgi:hypothetical protein